MNVTLSLDPELVKQVRKIAIEQDTTLTGLVRQHLQSLVQADKVSGRKRKELDRLERSFSSIEILVGERTWRREDLHARR